MGTVNPSPLIVRQAKLGKGGSYQRANDGNLSFRLEMN
jgi:hypothetical protein